MTEKTKIVYKYMIKNNKTFQIIIKLRDTMKKIYQQISGKKKSYKLSISISGNKFCRSTTWLIIFV